MSRKSDVRLGCVVDLADASLSIDVGPASRMRMSLTLIVCGKPGKLPKRLPARRGPSSSVQDASSSFAMDSQESDLLGRSHHLSGHPVYMNEDA